MGPLNNEVVLEESVIETDSANLVSTFLGNAPITLFSKVEDFSYQTMTINVILSLASMEANLAILVSKTSPMTPSSLVTEDNPFMSFGWSDNHGGHTLETMAI
jgi:hypothetical protein